MTVIVCPLDAAADACRDHTPTHIVSLLAPPAQAPVFDTPAARLHLSFNDIVVPSEGLIAPDAGHVARLIAFLDGWNGVSPLLIHCWAGVSRSTAAAFVAATLRDGPGSEAAVAQQLRQAAPFATPNRLIVALADDLLGRNGAMTNAVGAIGRGCDTDIGALFRL